MKAFIVVGPAGSGNHLWHTLIWSMRWQGQRLIGTDMLGWTDGLFKTHDQEMFANVWAGRDLLASVLPADSPPLVTGRSVPCGRDGRTMPDIGGFYREAVAVGYEATIVIASRDRTITRNESIGKKKLAEFTPDPAEWILAHARGRRHFFVSYESLLQCGRDYLCGVASTLGLDPPDEGWAGQIRDANAKYIAPVYDEAVRAR